jgi:hypothetical protein
MDSLACGVWAVHSEISSFEFEMQDSSIFKIFPDLSPSKNVLEPKDGAVSCHCRDDHTAGSENFEQQPDRGKARHWLLFTCLS